MFALIAQLVEHTLGKGEVTSSSLVEGSIAEKHSCIYLKENGKWQKNLTGANRT